MMARLDGVARTIYDRIKAATVRCPLCGAREVRQLDHHLPKTKYPAYTLLPANLVPSCRDCNEDKLAVSPTTSSEETIHPYFDDFASESWLYAEVKETQPPVIEYLVRAPTTWSTQKAARAEAHLATFGPYDYFSKMAGVLMGDIREQLLIQANYGGGGAIKQHLRDSAATRRKNQFNHWEIAAYEAMAASDWFCNSGYLYIRAI